MGKMIIYATETEVFSSFEKIFEHNVNIRNNIIAVAAFKRPTIYCKTKNPTVHL